MNKHHIILVDEHDNAIGTIDKSEAHKRGYLHRSFSVFITDSSGRLLLRPDAPDNGRSGGLWTNTCSGYPAPGESTIAAAQRQLRKEMGIRSTLHELFAFVGRCSLGDGSAEHKYDHVLLGVYDDRPIPDPVSVPDYRYWELEEINRVLKERPEQFSPWFRLSFRHMAEHFISRRLQG